MIDACDARRSDWKGPANARWIGWLMEMEETEEAEHAQASSISILTKSVEKRYCES